MSLAWKQFYKLKAWKQGQWLYPDVGLFERKEKIEKYEFRLSNPQ